MFVEWIVPNGVSGFVGGAAAALVLSGMAGLVVMAVKSRFWLDGERSKLVWVVRTYAAIYVVAAESRVLSGKYTVFALERG